MARILLIDDDTSLREVVGFMLQEDGHEVLPAADGAAGLERLTEDPDLVLTDIRMPLLDGMAVLRQVVEAVDQATPPVIVLTAHGTVKQAVEAMRLGAFSYLLKPFARDELLATVRQALHIRDLEQDNRRLRALLRNHRPESGLIFKDSAMGRFMAQVRQVAPSDANILLTGESGTGKELVSRACHDLSPRAEQPFVAVNCGAIPPDLMESELFGHAKGAFTGAVAAHEGRIRSAAGGTLFLDEVAELPLALQPKLLRVLETRLVDPVGGRQPVTVDFRLICATHRDLGQEVAAGRFREDLFYRLNVLRLDIPPLRQRPADIPLLWDHFTRLHGGDAVRTSEDLRVELASRDWPGNVRELKNLNLRMVLMRQDAELSSADLERLGRNAGMPRRAMEEAERKSVLPLGPLPASGVSLVEVEKELIRRALAACGGNRTRAAQFLEIPRHVLVYRLDKYKLG